MSLHRDLLELLQRGARFRTVRGVLRTRRDDELAVEAFRRERREAGGAGRFTVAWAWEDDSGPPVEYGEAVRFWFALPRRIREERAVRVRGRVSTSILVIDGPTWWSYDPALGAATNEGDLTHQHGSSIEGPLLEPSVLLPASTLEVVGKRTVAGRDGLAVRVRARRSLSGEFPHDLPAVGDLEIVVDPERAILLSLARTLDGRAYETTELVEVAFDEAFPAGTFTFEPPPGETLRTTRERQSPRRRLPLHELARLAPFTVLAAPRVPAGWKLHASLSRADGHQDAKPSAHLHYVAENGAARVNLHERAAAPGVGIDTPDGREWTLVERSEQQLRLWEPVGDDLELPRTILMERDGTRVLLTSSELAVEQLLDFAAALAPASPAAPQPW